tara:strand:+ start:2873 stop:3211 length:339 start_codon:yes stop_codon:yes gene_type:complete
MPDISNILVTFSIKKSKYSSIFNDKLVFETLTDEHVLRLVMLQKIKKARNLEDIIKIYLDKCELDDFNLNSKLHNLLKYESSVFNINILNIEDGYNKEEIENYNRKVSENNK